MCNSVFLTKSVRKEIIGWQENCMISGIKSTYVLKFNNFVKSDSRYFNEIKVVTKYMWYKK
jgi:hypothetical protein